MPRSDREWLEDVAAAARLIAEFTAGTTAEEYRQDKKGKAAVERLFILIGESLSQLERQSPNTAAGITARREIIGMRVILTHRFYEVDDRIIWAAALHDLPRLGAEVHQLLAQMEATS